MLLPHYVCTVRENGDEVETSVGQENGSEVCGYVDSLFGEQYNAVMTGV